MYEFNPLTSLELLQNMTQAPAPSVVDPTTDDPERRVQPARRVTLGDLVRRMFQRISSRRRAA